jgi:hypothetical protein
MEVNKVKEYNQKYYLDHKNDKYHCDICNKDYSAFNRDQHHKTMKHIKNKSNQPIKSDNNHNIDKIQSIINNVLLQGLTFEIKDKKLIIELKYLDNLK